MQEGTQFCWPLFTSLLYFGLKPLPHSPSGPFLPCADTPVTASLTGTEPSLSCLSMHVTKGSEFARDKKLCSSVSSQCLLWFLDRIEVVTSPLISPEGTRMCVLRIRKQCWYIAQSHRGHWPTAGHSYLLSGFLGLGENTFFCRHFCIQGSLSPSVISEQQRQAQPML